MNMIFTDSNARENSNGGFFTNFTTETSSFDSVIFTSHFSDSSLTSYLMTEWDAFSKEKLAIENGN